MSEPTVTPVSMASVRADEAIPHQRCNFAVMVAHLVLERMGWIFKLESVVIPAFVRTLTASNSVLAALPVLNRLGRRVPMLLGGRMAYGRPRLRRLLVMWTGLFAVLWGAVAAALWLLPARFNGPAFLVPFLGLYVIGFVFLGFAEVTRGALVGRVIPLRRRGLYVGLSAMLGGLTAIATGLVIQYLLLDGPVLESVQFAPLYGCAFAFFLLAALVVLFARERPQASHHAVPAPSHFWRRTREVLRKDRNFRRLVVAVLLWQVQGYVFPFYMAMGLDTGVITRGTLWILILVQNVSLAVSTMVMGVVADREGNRRVLLIAYAVTAAIPLVAVGAAHLPQAAAAHGWSIPANLPTFIYLFVFALIGFGPSLQRFEVNYVLEISAPADHAVYLSVFETLQLTTLIYAPTIAVVVQALSIGHAMLGASAVLVVGFVVATRLVEPRHHPPIAPEEVPAVPLVDGGG